MKWLISFFASTVGGFIVGIIKYFIKKFGFVTVATVIVSAFNTLIFAFFTAFLVFTTNYLLNLWNALSDLINSFNTFGNGVSGVAYGIDLSTIISNFWGFMYASGLSDALVTTGNLFMSVLSLIFIRALYLVYLRVAQLIKTMLYEGLNLLTS